MSTPRRLDTLRLANPCPAAWEEMVGDDRVRFCKRCQLHVYNLSALPRHEAEAFLDEREGRTCLRFYRRADGTILTRDCPVGLRAARRTLRFLFGAAVLALLVSATVLVGFFGGSRRRQEGITWLRGTNVVQTVQQVEPFKTVLDWLDPPGEVLCGDW
jgi:hypothetical protein